MNTVESQNISKSPFFDGNNYSHWKAKMTIFIQSLDYNLWVLIVDGPHLPSIRDENGESIPKPRNTYNDDDGRRVQLNAKAKHVIICAINSSEFNIVSSCISAKEMWDRLEVTYKGINQVKDAKISMLVHDYELFPMNEDEDIKSIFTRFTNIINALQSLDKTYSNSELVRKILRCLPRSWLPKVTAIEEAKNLSILPLEDLQGSLMTHELTMQKRDEEEEEEENEEVIYDELIIMCEKYNSMIASLKKKVKTLTNENDELKTIDFTKEINSKDVEIDFLENEVAHLEEENKNLKVEIEALKKTFSKFSSSSEKLENLLGMQMCVFDKAGLEYEEMNNVKHYQNFFERKEMIEKNKIEKIPIKKKVVKITCEYCGKIGHISSSCYHKRNVMIKRNDINSCNYCGKYGHISSSCFHKKNAMSKKIVHTSCIHCGKFRHKSSLCFYKRNIMQNINIVNKGKINVSCNNCGKLRHISTSCFYKKNILNDSNFARIKKSWVPKGTIVTNPKGPKTSWVPQTNT
ncbi:zf-CCHC domain-containing protein/DUF4219 domain-containing protein/UBN2 domain-containing protein [Cephalotus follicularis]|uniref:Zf-CCHC domain-containing protein/DUF4219 domain-containing protein/UBN2 domain-containing protein n=1 Tax=Cephalotus follicularis TaxID=3775 RepID=A0A1Q3ARL0_CEPFO|nr:zf-CCHC domain-containing protein/DUF4219 domain-containing protein/UBN2 domain-containing protein [Cephalotus follicularis]